MARIFMCAEKRQYAVLPNDNDRTLIKTVQSYILVLYSIYTGRAHARETSWFYLNIKNCMTQFFPRPLGQVIFAIQNTYQDICNKYSYIFFQHITH